MEFNFSRKTSGIIDPESLRRLAKAQIAAPVIGGADKRIRKIVLYGSTARGQAKWDSDVDLRLVVDSPEEWEIYNNATRALRAADIQEGADPLLDIQTLQSRLLEDPGEVIGSIRADGIFLWGRE